MAQVIREVMTSEPITVQPTASLQEAARKMRDSGIGDVLIAEDERLRGVVTDRDITIRAVAEGRDPSSTTVDEICSHDLVLVGPEDDVDEAIQLMRDRSIRRVLVVEDGAAVGMVSLGDMAMERDQRSALADISAAPPNR